MCDLKHMNKGDAIFIHMQIITNALTVLHIMYIL